MPLERSYTDLGGRKRRTGQWQRSKTHPTAPARPQALLPVSESTKNKLDAFRAPPQPIDNDAAIDDGVTSLPRPRGPNVTPGAKGNNGVGDINPNRVNTATTPIGRLAWEDIMGHHEELKPVEEDKDELSPTDRLGWDHARRSSISLTPLVARGLRKRSRARSSSPTMSPNSSKRTPATPATVKTGPGPPLFRLKTPRADPMLDLWDRCAMPGMERTSESSGLTNPLLAQFMVSSSPRPDETSSASRPLRKSMSYGSTFKRRRVDGSGLTPGAGPQGSPQKNTKLSMVSALLETVDGEIQKSVLEAERRSSPSPSPEKRPSQRRTHSHDRTMRPPAFHGGGSQRDELEISRLRPSQGEAAPQISMPSSSSDYGGDFDLDEETLMAIDTTTQTLAENDVAPVTPENAIPEQPLAQDVASLQVEVPVPRVLDADNEFDDLDDDFFDDAEDLVAAVESAYPSQAVEGVVHPPVSFNAIQHAAQEQLNEDEYGDAFGGDIDLEAVELAATQSAASRKGTAWTHQSSQKPRAIQRYKIDTVVDSTFENDRGRDCPEKILIVQADRSNSIRTIHLRDDWIDTPATVGAYVHVIGEFEHSGMCVVDNNQSILILHPDQLISSTVVADSFSCTRRAVLQDRVKATSDPTPPLIYGTILHEIFQEAMMANQWDTVFLSTLINRILKNHLEDLYTIKVSLIEARDHVLSKMTELRSWASAFVSSYPQSEATVQGRNGEKARMCVAKLLDVEEHVWSPMYGLKGNIDATVQVTMQEADKTYRTLTVPFEVKTGKNPSTNHQAQTVLYNLLISDRYDIDVLYGVLYYMESSQTLRIPAIRHELRHMIMQRNQLACHVRERSVQLPEMKRNKNVCGKCYAQNSCFIYHKLADDGDGETSGMGIKFDEVVGHLTPTHKEFFLKWEDLLTKEEKESQKHRRELWTMLSTEREKVGRCFSNVIIEEGSAHEESHKAKINRYTYTFVKDPAHALTGFSFLESQLTVGEPIVVSDEMGHFALALGYVTVVKKHRISVAVDRRLHNARIRQPGFDKVNNQVFASIMEVAHEGAKPEQTQGKIKEAPVQYRLDKDEFSNGMATVRNNLVKVMADGPLGSKRIRELVVDRAPPRFKSVTTQYAITSGDSLNVDQKRAIEKVMSAKDYALVLGMPGTGKTTTIAHIIRALVAQGKSVLLTSYTHTAVDNILLKLKTDQVPIMRMGAPAKVHPEVREFVTLAAEPKTSFEEIKAAWHDTPIVATTCLGIGHALFTERTFDYCIVDEASQITLPICLGPIRLARTFVLVGDHNQLPPLVQNEEARLGGLDVSLFKLLSDTHPQSVVNLEHQYRMCEDIMTLSNTLIYNGRLRCGTEALRFSSLDVPAMHRLHDRHMDASTFMSSQRGGSKRNMNNICTSPTPGQCWLADLLDPEVRVRFVSTDAIPGAREEAKGNRIVNACEANIVAQLVDALLTVGVPPSEIGVMTHYRSQLALLRHSLLGLARAHGANGGGGIEMHTADRFQGRDKEVVVLSLVRSNDACNIGDLLKDWRRINVAFTRAKTKLLVVGSHATLKACGEGEMLARFVGLMERRDWIYALPPDALHMHCFDEAPGGTSRTQLPPATPPKTGEHSKAPAGASPGCKAAARQALLARQDKENGVKLRQPKKGKITERVLLKGRTVLRDILNDMTDGAY